MKPRTAARGAKRWGQKVSSAWPWQSQSVPCSGYWESIPGRLFFRPLFPGPSLPSAVLTHLRAIAVPAPLWQARIPSVTHLFETVPSDTINNPAGGEKSRGTECLLKASSRLLLRDVKRGEPPKRERLADRGAGHVGRAVHAARAFAAGVEPAASMRAPRIIPFS